MDHAYELQTHRAEDRHWWYRGRRRVIHAVIGSLELPEHARILDAGCGSGRNMVELAGYGEVSGIELSETAVEAARARHVGEVVAGSLDRLPFADERFDLAVCLDVIEHLDDDRGALAELRRVIAPGGSLLVTVPAYQWLWSAHDEINQHRRRYRRQTLLEAASAAGWRCVRSTYFNSLLLPIAIAARLAERLRRGVPESSPDLWIPPAPMNRLLQLPLDLEARAIANPRLSIPAGLSLLAVLR
ncbi:MAG: class I SAM-dependent methyltransferase [Solirubrobacteraceae bacterium]